MEDLVIVRRDGHIAELVLNRASALNAISTDMANELVVRGDELATDRSLRAVVVSSAAEEVFCVGADLKERSTFDDAALVRQRDIFRKAFGTIRDLPMPTIAAVRGYALGGGLEIALSCDLVVADETARLGLPEVSVGLVPGGGGTQLVARRVGLAVASDLVLTGRHLTAAEALALRLVNRVVASRTAPSEAIRLARAIAQHSPIATRAAKRALRFATSTSLEAGLEIEHAAWLQVVNGGEWSEGMASFVEHRPPNWQAEIPLDEN